MLTGVLVVGWSFALRTTELPHFLAELLTHYSPWHWQTPAYDRLEILMLCCRVESQRSAESALGT